VAGLGSGYDRWAVSDFSEQPPASEGPRSWRSPFPPWMGEPEGVLPGIVVVEMVLARNDRAAVFVGALEVFPARVEFTVRALTTERLRPLALGRANPLAGSRPGGPQGARPWESLQLSVEFADGQGNQRWPLKSTRRE
jgi:hypothetical protein